VSLASVGCADGEFEQLGPAGDAEALGQVTQRWGVIPWLPEEVDALEQKLTTLEDPLPACNPTTLCAAPAGGGAAPCTISGNVLHVTGDLTFPASCSFMGQVKIDASHVDLDCNGSVIDARAVAWFGIQHSETAAGSQADHDGCTPAKQRPANITIRNCTVKYAQADGLTFDRALGETCQSPTGSCQSTQDQATYCNSEAASFFGASNGGEHQVDPAHPYPLPEYLRQEISARDAAEEGTDWGTRLGSSLTDAEVMDILRWLGPSNIVLDNVALLYNRRAQLYVRSYTTDFTIRSSLLVQSPRGAKLGTSTQPFICESTVKLDNAVGWPCQLVEPENLRLLCEALRASCRAEYIEPDEEQFENPTGRRRYTVYVDRDSRRTTISGVDFRRDMSEVPDTSRELDQGGYPTHLALDTTADNKILDSRFSGAANGIISFKNCGERNSYRFQSSERNTIAGNEFALAPEATAVWLGSRQGARLRTNDGSPFNCFHDDEESYPWLTIPTNEPPLEDQAQPPLTIYDKTRYAIFSNSYSNQLDAADYCRDELPDMVGDVPVTVDKTMFFDFSVNNEIRGNWFVRETSAKPSVILWDGAHQTVNVVAGNFTNFTQPPGVPATKAALCRRNGFLALVGQQRPDDGSGLSVPPAPAGWSNSSVAPLHMALSVLY
jgi:hypothetical protein